MKTELIKILKLNFIVGISWIAQDMLVYYYHHHHFSVEELIIAAKPISAVLTMSIIYVTWKFRKK